jgi:hypothetical protein
MNYADLTVADQCRLCWERAGAKRVEHRDEGWVGELDDAFGSLPDLSNLGACIALLERWANRRKSNRRFSLDRNQPGMWWITLVDNGHPHFSNSPDLPTAIRLAFLAATEPPTKASVKP